MGAMGLQLSRQAQTLAVKNNCSTGCAYLLYRIS
jgi:hypothetical protein